MRVMINRMMTSLLQSTLRQEIALRSTFDRVRNLSEARIGRPRATTISWGFVPQSKSVHCQRKQNSPSRRKINSICTVLESDYGGCVDPKYSSGRTKASVCKYSTEKRGSHNKFCKYAKEYMYIRRGSKLIRKACDRTCSERPGRSRILQHIFHRSQKGRRFSPDSKSEGTEYIFESAPFQDGDSKNNHLCIRTKRLGSFHRFKGCVPSRRSVSSTQKVSTILHYGKSLPISSHALRPGSSAKNLHKAHGSDRQLSQSTGDSDLHVPRRLADKKSEPRDSRKSIQDGVTVDRAPRSHSKSCQVSFGAQSGDSVPRGRVQSPGGNDLSYIGEMHKNTGGNQVANVSDTSDSTVVSPCFRIDGVLHRPNTTGTITYAPYPVLYPVILAPTQGQLVSCYPSAGYVDSTPQTVAGLQQYYGRDTSSSSHSIVLWTDASQMGWGAHMEDHQVSGTWTVQEKEQHINWLEMKAVQQALIHF